MSIVTPKKAFHEEMYAELGGKPKQSESKLLSLSQELLFILIKFTYIVGVGFVFFYGFAFIYVIQFGGGLDAVRERVLITSFFVFLISSIVVGVRGYLGGYMLFLNSFKITFLGQKHDSNKIKELMNFVFGIKLDVLAFYGSLIIFVITYVFI